jgi:hypothetical protein
MTTFTPTFVVLTCLLVVSACEPTARSLDGDGYSGVILEHSCDEGAKPWIPTREDIAKFEGALPHLIVTTERLAATPLRATLPRYRRRYAGQEVAGSRILCITFIHDESQSVRSGRWRTANRYGIVGGGYQVWSLKFDVDHERVVDIEFQAGE